MSDLCNSPSSPLRVVSVAHSAVGQKGGRQRYTPLLRQSDIDLHLVVPQNWREFGRSLVGEPAADPALQLHVLPILFPSAGPLNWYLHCYPGLPRLLRKVRPHVLHLWEEPWSIVALQAALTKRDAALILEVDQNILKTLPAPFETIRRFVLKKCAHVLARSPDAEAVVRASGYDGPVSMIGYGVDQHCFRPDERAAPRGEGLRIGYVGKLVEEKGLDDVLDALARTQSMVSLALIGAGPHGVKLRARVERLGLTDRVSFRDWAAPHEVAEFMRGLDALDLVHAHHSARQRAVRPRHHRGAELRRAGDRLDWRRDSRCRGGWRMDHRRGRQHWAGAPARRHRRRPRGSAREIASGAGQCRGALHL